MRLTRKDAVATLVMGVNTLVYVACLAGTGLPVIGSSRGAAATILVLGIIGGCALGDARREETPAAYSTFMGLLGGIALAAATVGILFGGELPLTVLFAATVALWLATTIRHALTPRSASSPGAGPVKTAR